MRLLYLLLYVLPRTTTADRRRLTVGLALIAITVTACREAPKVTPEPSREVIARTEFTPRLENFFEYEAISPGKPSRFTIHLTALAEGAPVERAAVTLMIRPAANGPPIGEVRARPGRVEGIYLAEVLIARPGRYAIEFHVKSAAFDEKMVLGDFAVEGGPTP
jgi:5-hydroxyisourate hydrolase-like protein (transthyretin family)